MFKLKKLRRALEKEFKKRYDQLEERYLNMEGNIYLTLENRLGSLEQKFDDLNDLLKEEIRTRKERNEERQAEIVFDKEENEGEALSDKLNEVKDTIVERVQDAKEDFNETLSKGVKKAKKILDEAIEEVQERRRADEAARGTQEANEEVQAPETKDDLTKIKGLGAKFAEKLATEGITSFAQLAKMSKKEREAMDAKIKSFAARYERYDWGKQAKELK